MKIQVNPEAVAANQGRPINVKAFGKDYTSNDEVTVTADEWKKLKGLQIVAGGRTLAQWAEVKEPKSDK